MMSAKCMTITQQSPLVHIQKTSLYLIALSFYESLLWHLLLHLKKKKKSSVQGCVSPRVFFFPLFYLTFYYFSYWCIHSSVREPCSIVPYEVLMSSLRCFQHSLFQLKVGYSARRKGCSRNQNGEDTVVKSRVYSIHVNSVSFSS